MVHLRSVITFSQRDGWGHLYLHDGTTGALKNQITKGEWLVRDIIDVDEETRRIYFTGGGREGGNPYYRYLYRVNFDGSGLMLLSPEKTDHVLTGSGQRLASTDGATPYTVVSPSGKYVVYTYSTPTEPPQTAIRSTADGRLIAIVEHADASAVYAAGWRPPEEFVVKAADGSTDLWGLLYKPRNFDPAKRYPVIDAQYISWATTATPRDFAYTLLGSVVSRTGAELAELGFIVVTLDARGAPNRSFAISTDSMSDRGREYSFIQLQLQDHSAAIRELGRRFPFIDTTRVGITGASYGGTATILALTDFSDLYKVGVAGWPGGPAKAAPLRGKLLIMMGELDENVLPYSTLRYVDQLMKANQLFDLVYFPNAMHGRGIPSYITRRTYDYFVSNLMRAIPPTSDELNRPGH